MQSFFSRLKHSVFKLRVLPKGIEIKPKIETKFELHCLKSVSGTTLRQIVKIQGCFSFLYLAFRYGSKETFIALARADNAVVHISWVIPSKKCKRRYYFVPEGSYLIGPCTTVEDYRGNNIFPFVLGGIANSGCGQRDYRIFAEDGNQASVRAIEKAGGEKIGDFLQKKWLWGIISQVRFLPFSDTRN